MRGCTLHGFTDPAKHIHFDERIASCNMHIGSCTLICFTIVQIRLWDCATGRCLVIFEGHEENVTSLCAQNTGKALLSASADK